MCWSSTLVPLDEASKAHIPYFPVQEEVKNNEAVKCKGATYFSRASASAAEQVEPGTSIMENEKLLRATV